MFDVGLSEMMVIAIVALIVIGPERLPKVARTAGLLLGRLQRYVGDVKADISREMQLEEMKKLQQQMNEKVMSLEASVSQELREVEGTVNKAVAGPFLGEAAVAPTPTSVSPEAVVAPTPAVAAAPTETPKSV